MFGLFKKKKDALFRDGIITSPFKPKPELQSEKGARKYVSKIVKLTHSDLCVELACVMGAKYNIMSGQTGPTDWAKRQEIVTDLTDKATVICMAVFGESTVLNYTGNNLTLFNELVNTIDNEVANKNLDPEKHGNLMLSKISDHL